MPNIDLSILNQRQTPAFFADTLANRPAAGFVGRIFISTDTLDLYRDTGTTWLLLSPSSTGTITGSGAAGQVTYFSGTSSITGNNNLFYDTGNNRLGINTNTPTAPLDIHSSLSGSLMQLNQTSGTLDSQLAFQSANVGKWRIGSYYNSGQYSFGIYDVFNSRERFSVLNTGQTFVGDQISSSGKLVVNSGSLGDTGLVVISQSSPSIRINNGGTGANFRCGFGIATATNNFIQGSVDGDFCIFNANTGTYPILFGINDTGLGNVQEAARISSARNFLVGTSVDGGFKLSVNGTTFLGSNVSIGTSGTNDISWGTAGGIKLSRTNIGPEYALNQRWTGSLAFVDIASSNQWNGGVTILANGGGNCGIGTNAPTEKLDVRGNIYTNGTNTNIYLDNGGVGGASLKIGVTGTTQTYIYSLEATDPLLFGTANTERLRILATGELVFKGASTITNYGSIFENTDTQFIIYSSEGAGITKDIKIQAGGSASAPRVWLKAGGNFLIGTDTDAGLKLQTNGKGYFADDVYIGNTTISAASPALFLQKSGVISGVHNYTSGTINLIEFYKIGAGIGTISYDGTLVLYNSTSDYRLKQDYRDYNGLDLVNKIKTYDYEWKENKKRGYGVIAHELQSVIDYAVTGEKDGKDMQQVDYSKIVPVLIKAIQELNNKIENLK
jgi:hypothetical protein